MNNYILPISILYIEDDPITLTTISSMLQRRVKRLFTASDGLQGLEAFYKFKPDIVITDIKMPFIDGIELTRTIKKHFPDVFVIVTTAFEDKEIISKFYAAGVDFYIIKPISKDKLFNAISLFAKVVPIDGQS